MDHVRSSGWTTRFHRAWRCGPEFSSRCCSPTPPRSRIRNWPNCIPAPAVRTCSPNRHSWARPTPTGLLESPSSSSDGLRIFTTGCIPESWWRRWASWSAISSAISPPTPSTPALPGPVFMALIAIIFSYFVALYRFRGVSGSTNVNIAINGIQIAALLFFSALAIAYRISHPEGSAGLALDSAGNVIKTVVHYARRETIPRMPARLSVIAAASLRLGDAPGDDRDSAAGRL